MKNLEHLMHHVLHYIDVVKRGFTPDPNAKGWRSVVSRLSNLWRVGLPGKILISFVMATLIFSLINFGEEADVKRQVDNDGDGSYGAREVADNRYPPQEVGSRMPVTPEASPMIGVTIKGFYVGMPAVDAVNLINQKYSDAFFPLRVKKPDDLELLGEIEKELVRQYSPPIELVDTMYGSGIHADEWWNFGEVILHKNSMLFGDYQFSKINLNDKKVEEKPWRNGFDIDDEGSVEGIMLASWAVNILFNVHDMKGEDFAQALVNNYDIPALEGDRRGFWVYTYPDGMRVRVFEDKGIILDKVAAESERRFD